MNLAFSLFEVKFNNSSHKDVIMKIIHILVLTSLFALSSAANAAVIVNVAGQNWAISTVEGTYSAVGSSLVQPWFENDRDGLLAIEFTTAVGEQLGAQVNFAYFHNIPFYNSKVWNPTNEQVYTVLNQPSDVRIWATASAVPIPAAAWLFGSALLGLGAMKRKRS
ncbi:MAG: VPLPA-CTERM sorting domain-containing protein [Halioglobus sp.]